MISVIIPTHNRCQLLAETLDSVYAQTRRDYEIIVVDDGSDDGTQALCASGTGGLVYHRIPRSGASAARNIGLALARGEYVAFLDSDDLWEPTFLERMVAAIETSPAAGFCYCDYGTFGAHGTERGAYLPPQHKLHGKLFAPLLETDFLSTGAILIRRACFSRIGGFDQSLKVAHDWDLWLRLAHAFDAEFVDEPLVRIRIDSNGLTRDTRTLLLDNLQVLAKWQRALERSEQDHHVLRQNMAACHRSLFGLALSSRKPRDIFQHGLGMLRSELP
jgi:glycosyltransferase involved in cell wall biosynthesis